MIYLDTSVVLAELLVEDRRLNPSSWDEPLVSSRLLEYETWTRLNGRGASASVRDAAKGLLARINLLELSSLVLARALAPFPEPVRTLDALHLASVLYLVERGVATRLATFDDRQRRVAEALGIAILA